MENYKELRALEKAHRFTSKVCEVSKPFPKNEFYRLTNQVASATASSFESCGKYSRLELAHFLNTSLGSANESKNFLILSKDLNYLNAQDFIELSEAVNEIKVTVITLGNKVRAASKT